MLLSILMCWTCSELSTFCLCANWPLYQTSAAKNYLRVAKSLVSKLIDSRVAQDSEVQKLRMCRGGGHISISVLTQDPSLPSTPLQKIISEGAPLIRQQKTTFFSIPTQCTWLILRGKGNFLYLHSNIQTSINSALAKLAFFQCPLLFFFTILPSQHATIITDIHIALQ